jgi:ATP-dependent DNA ligase
VAIYDQQLRSRFEWLRQREPEAVASSPVFMAFDLLYRDGRDLSARPLRDRRARLENVVAGNNLVFLVRRLAPDGLEAWAQVVERGYEGYVAKDAPSTGSPSSKSERSPRSPSSVRASAVHARRRLEAPPGADAGVQGLRHDTHDPRRRPGQR